MTSVVISTRIDEDLLAEIDTFAAAKDKTRSEAIVLLLRSGLTAKGSTNERTAGWDAKEIARIAVDYYSGMAPMFEAHDWPERGAQMLPNVQRRVGEHYGSVQKFIDHHAACEPQDIQKNLQPKERVVHQAAQPWSARPVMQRDAMRDLVRKHGLVKETVCASFADGLRSGQIRWKNNTVNFTPEKYADAVWRDGEIKGWLANSLPTVNSGLLQQSHNTQSPTSSSRTLISNRRDDSNRFQSSGDDYD